MVGLEIGRDHNINAYPGVSIPVLYRKYESLEGRGFGGGGGDSPHIIIGYHLSLR